MLIIINTPMDMDMYFNTISHYIIILYFCIYKVGGDFCRRFALEINTYYNSLNLPKNFILIKKSF